MTRTAILAALPATSRELAERLGRPLRSAQKLAQDAGATQPRYGGAWVAPVTTPGRCRIIVWVRGRHCATCGAWTATTCDHTQENLIGVLL